jgi:hypothetical protein
MPKLDKNGLVPVSWMNRTQWLPPTTPLLRSFAMANSSVLNQPPVFPSDPRNTVLPSPIFDAGQQLVLHPHPSKAVHLEVIINNSDEAPHPFHLHGHKFYVMAVSESRQGWGQYRPDNSNDDMITFDETTAPLRDTFSVPRRGFAVFRWALDNPGVWAMHCHVLVHMHTGMAFAVADQPQLLEKLPFATLLSYNDAACPARL